MFYLLPPEELEELELERLLELLLDELFDELLELELFEFELRL